MPSWLKPTTSSVPLLYGGGYPSLLNGKMLQHCSKRLETSSLWQSHVCWTFVRAYTPLGEKAASAYEHAAKYTQLANRGQNQQHAAFLYTKAANCHKKVSVPSKLTSFWCIWLRKRPSPACPYPAIYTKKRGGIFTPQTAYAKQQHSTKSTATWQKHRRCMKPQLSILYKNHPQGMSLHLAQTQRCSGTQRNVWQRWLIILQSWEIFPRLSNIMRK